MKCNVFVQTLTSTAEMQGKWGEGGIQKNCIKATYNLFFGLLKVPMHIASSRAWQNVFTLRHFKKKKRQQDTNAHVTATHQNTNSNTTVLARNASQIFLTEYPCDLHFTCTCSRSIYRNYKLQLRLLKCLSAKHLFFMLHMHLENMIPRYRQDFCC